MENLKATEPLYIIGVVPGINRIDWNSVLKSNLIRRKNTITLLL